eukprot:11883038-Alexandrium_andersonii.AAC.1
MAPEAFLGVSGVGGSPSPGEQQTARSCRGTVSCGFPRCCCRGAALADPADGRAGPLWDRPCLAPRAR